MPTWGEVLEELRASPVGGVEGAPPDLDGVRRRYLAQVHSLTGRDVILYASDWLGGGQPSVSIVLEDILGMMETCRGLKGPGLDLILHSPGGDPNATASLVRYLRGRYEHIRAIVPVAAMSAATMWALAADEIVMGAHSQLGPIDPQMVTSAGQFPARAILQQFGQAKEEIQLDPNAFAAWVPILQGYGPSLLQECAFAEDLAKRLVRVWLRTWMLRDRGDRSLRAARIAKYFADYSKHQSHGAGISREEARKRGVIVHDLEDDPALQDAILSVHHATMLTFANSGAVKIVENHLGKAWVKAGQMVQIVGPGGPAQIIPPS
jgi:hypothetical protein